MTRPFAGSTAGNVQAHDCLLGMFVQAGASSRTAAETARMHAASNTSAKMERWPIPRHRNDSAMPLEEALARADELYYQGAVRMFRFIKTGMMITEKSEK